MGATTEPAGAARVSGTIRYWAAAKSEAGLAEEPYEAATLAEALAAARTRHADRPKLVRLLGHCSYLVDGSPVGGRDHATVSLTEGGTVEVLPPFAGG
ncbi:MULTISPECIES: MoaD/ThiS family protein [unclassified Kitasatospora]|uniref:MoaD/ThiS family protein n=1 Tax=unclassified Kitasatospora TaxID=2633591 RepID=UPI002E31C62E|nr:MoaD/ThiS family protein [Kitasatospora sp. NBC_01246]